MLSPGFEEDSKVSVYFRFRMQARFRARLLRLPFQPRGALAGSRCAPRQAFPVETCFSCLTNAWCLQGLPAYPSALMEKRDFSEGWTKSRTSRSTPDPQNQFPAIPGAGTALSPWQDSALTQLHELLQVYASLQRGCTQPAAAWSPDGFQGSSRSSGASLHTLPSRGWKGLPGPHGQ